MGQFDQPFFTIVIPTFNEEDNLFFHRTLSNLKFLRGHLSLEILVVDRNSEDKTQELAKASGAKVILTSNNSRSVRLNLGFKESLGKVIVFHHPRSEIDPNGLYYIKNHYHSLSWGGFTHKFDLDLPLLNFTSWYSNNVRGKLKQILYLDHCLFLRKDLYQKQYLDNEPFPTVDIFEDTLFSLKMKALGDLEIIPFTSTTSSIRFNRNGLWKQSLMNQWLKIAFYLDLPLERMNQIYEKGLSLNSIYHNESE